MRIGLVYLGRKGAGGPISLEIAKHLKPRAEVFPYLSTYLENLAQWKAEEIEVFLITPFSGWISGLISLIFPLRINKLARRIREDNPDILIYPMSHPWLSRLQKKTNKPAVFIVHDALPHPGLFGSLVDMFDEGLIKLVDACIVFSPQMKPHLIDKKVPEENIHVLELGSYGQYSAKYGQENKRKNNIPTILFFGRIEKYKGLEYLLEAFDVVLQKTEARLLIVGYGNVTPYQRMIRKNQEFIEVVNEWISEEEIGTYFQQSDLVVLPYTSASQSGVIPIAADFSLPIIATRTGGIPSQIDEDRTGILVEPKNPDALAKKITLLLNDENLGISLGSNLHNEFRKQKSWDRFSEEVYKLCQAVISKNFSASG